MFYHLGDAFVGCLFAKIAAKGQCVKNRETIMLDKDCT